LGGGGGGPFNKFFVAINAYFMSAAHSAVILKAESMADKIEWIKKIKGVIQSRGGSVKGPTEDGPMRQSRSDGSLVSSGLDLSLVSQYMYILVDLLALAESSPWPMQRSFI
jgi:hypothetical protein